MSVRGVFNDVVINTSGNVLANVQVDVYAVGTTTPVTIYSSRTGGSTLSNPIITGSTGNVYFFAPPGTYSVKFSDTISPVRFSTRTVVWDSVSGDTADGGIALTQLEGGTANRALITNGATGRVEVGQIDAAALATDAVTNVKIADDAVTEAKIDTNAINNSHLQSGIVTEDELQNASVITAKIDDEAVTGNKIDPQTFQSGTFSFTPGGLGPAASGTQSITTMANTSYTVFLQPFKSSFSNVGPMFAGVTARNLSSFEWIWIGGGTGDSHTMFYLVVASSL